MCYLPITIICFGPKKQWNLPVHSFSTWRLSKKCIDFLRLEKVTCKLCLLLLAWDPLQAPFLWPLGHPLCLMTLWRSSWLGSIPSLNKWSLVFITACHLRHQPRVKAYWQILSTQPVSIQLREVYWAAVSPSVNGTISLPISQVVERWQGPVQVKWLSSDSIYSSLHSSQGWGLVLEEGQRFQISGADGPTWNFSALLLGLFSPHHFQS